MRTVSMSIIISMQRFDHHDVYFHKPVYNTIIPNSKFIRTVYSNGLVTLNNICLEVPIDITRVKRNRFFFDVHHNDTALSFLMQIEENILQRSGILNKLPRKRMTEQLENGFLKIYTPIDDGRYDHPILLKISGLWESESEFGITFKFTFALPIGHKVRHDGFHDRDKYQVKHR